MACERKKSLYILTTVFCENSGVINIAESKIGTFESNGISSHNRNIYRKYFSPEFRGLDGVELCQLRRVKYHTTHAL